jgi:ATPase subunit of ABC transporter with duplicated ATPase domains
LLLLLLDCLRLVQVDSITIPVGPRLGDKVLAVDGVNKAFGERLLVDGMSFDVPPGGHCILHS